MSTFNHSSSYNRTYEKKVIEESPRVRMSSPFSSSALPSGIPASFIPAGFPSSVLSGAIPSSFASSFSSLSVTDDSINVTLDVSQFKPDDLTVSVIGQQIVIEGKHGEKQDEIGTIERSFTRRIALPRGVQAEAVTSNLTPEGLLTIVALPPRPKEHSPSRTIPIKVVTTSAAPSPSTAKQPTPPPAAAKNGN